MTQQREIRFRAWDTVPSDVFKRPCMYDWSYLKQWNMERMGQRGVYLMQFTGRHDVSGTPIFESDILLSASGKEYYIVIWDKSGWKLQSIANKKRIINSFNSTVRFQQIKGNIYQNENLLIT